MHRNWNAFFTDNSIPNLQMLDISADLDIIKIVKFKKRFTLNFGEKMYFSLVAYVIFTYV